jgi:predicted dehydrogenase
MQAFMRRFDAPLRHARALLEAGRIGTPFKIVSVLEDPLPPPVGYNSPGILTDMAVHNADEVIWLLGDRPESVSAVGANLHNFKISPVKEDFDDAFMQVRFAGGAVAQVQVSRNHVAGYRNETWVFGDRGTIHVGGFQEDPLRVAVEAYSREGVVEKKAFRMRDYGEQVPVFIERFGPAYREETAHFVERCLKEEPFSVTQEDGLSAMRVVEAGVRSLRAGGGWVACA